MISKAMSLWPSPQTAKPRSPLTAPKRLDRFQCDFDRLLYAWRPRRSWRRSAQARPAGIRGRPPCRPSLAAARSSGPSGWMPARMAAFSWIPRRVTSFHQAWKCSTSKIGCVIRKAAPGGGLLRQPQHLQFQRIGIGRGHARPGRTAPRRRCGLHPTADSRRPTGVGLEQLDRVDVVDILGGAEPAQRLVAAAGAKQVADSQGLGAECLGDQRDAVAVAGVDVQDRLDPLGRHQRRRG